MVRAEVLEDLIKTMTVNKRIDNKHSIMIGTDGVPRLAKRLGNGILQPIPEDEPTILFRGRDRLALPMLKYYRGLCVADGCTDFQMKSMDDMIEKFELFSGESDKMKQPGVTRGF